MLSEALPIYSGGLGNVSGDELKLQRFGRAGCGSGTALPAGLFSPGNRQGRGATGALPYNDPDSCRSRRCADQTVSGCGWRSYSWIFGLGARMAGPGGQRKLYFLDSNDAANFPVHRGITSEFYGGGSELRLAQELLAWVWRMAAAWPARDSSRRSVNLNEGHAGL